MDIWTGRVFQHAGLFYLPVLLYLSSTACSSPADRARQELTRRGIEPNTESFNRNVDSGNAEVVALLVDAGIQPRLALRRAARNSRCEIVELLLDKGYDPTGIQAADALGQSMAHHSEECARTLREVGADLRARDLRGENLLTLAARKGTPQSMKELLDLGLSVDEPNRSGETAAIVAAQANRADQMEVLIAVGTDVDAADPDGWRALTYAARADHGEVVRRLIDAGAEVNTMTRTGWTPLMMAVAEGHADIAETLLEADANPDISSSAGLSPLILAAQRGDVRTVKALLLAGADPDIRVDGVDAAWWAASEGDEELAALLGNATPPGEDR